MKKKDKKILVSIAKDIRYIDFEWSTANIYILKEYIYNIIDRKRELIIKHDKVKFKVFINEEKADKYYKKIIFKYEKRSKKYG